MSEASVIRGKSYEDIERQADRVEMMAIRALNPENAESRASFTRRMDAIARIRSRYQGNIRRSDRFRAAQELFNREGTDTALRANLRSLGVNTYAEMYQRPYSRATYMRGRRRNNRR